MSALRARATLLSFGLFACSEADPLVIAHPKLDLDDVVIDFGPVPEGSTAERKLRLGNVGPVPLNLSLRLGLGATEELTLVVVTATVPPSGATDISLSYAPTDPGRDETMLIIGSDDPDRTETHVPVRGGPIAPSVEVSPSPVDFGPATMDRVSRALAIKNVGLATLHLESVAIDPAANGDFTLRAPPSSMVLGPTSEVEVIVDYQRSTRATAGRLLVRSDDTEQPELEARLLPDPFHACEDRADNDGDQLLDFPDDPGCTSATDEDESNPSECSPGMMMPCGSDTGECAMGQRTCTSSTWGPCDGDTPPSPELCDGLDNDCDLRTDEDVSEACTENGCPGARACVEGSSVPGGEWTACLPIASTAEICDGVDNNCDGNTDEGIVENCVLNGCSGTRICVPGGSGQYTACQVAPQSESCDGLDNDCNGTSDDGIPDLACGVGVCRRTALACNVGVPGTCTPGTPGTEVCNALDDNCDSTVDNLPNLVCGTGACLRSVAACVGGANNTCTPGSPVAETCNNQDDNCDSLTDNLPALSCGLGACQRSVAACSGGAPNTCVPGAPVTELCNNQDDNCDGSPDNLPNLNCGTGACARSVAACVGGANNTCVAGMPATEVCNNQDDNCDGAPDNLPNLVCGVGACLRTVVACVGGANNTCVPGTGTPEVCNGIDDNCSGAIDEGACAVCGLMSTAADPQEPNNATGSANPDEAHPGLGTFVHEYDLTFPLSTDSDWIQFNFPPAAAGGTSGTMTAEILCVSWASAGCAMAPTVGLEAWYYDDLFNTLGQLDGTNPGTAGLPLVTSTGPIFGLDIGQKFRLRAYPSASVCAGEAANAHLRVTVDFN